LTLHITHKSSAFGCNPPHKNSPQGRIHEAKSMALQVQVH